MREAFAVNGFSLSSLTLTCKYKENKNKINEGVPITSFDIVWFCLGVSLVAWNGTDL